MTFPVLKGVSEAPDPALRCGDWLATVRIKVSTMSKTADKYWNRIFDDSTSLYERFLGSGTLERLNLKFGGLENETKWSRLRAEVSGKLLESIPESMSTECVSDRKTHPTQLVYRVLIGFQPGGTAERAALIKTVENIGTFTSPAEGVASIKTWERRKTRALELGATLPDSTVLLRAIDAALKDILVQYPNMAFRINLRRDEIKIEGKPTLEKVETLM